jgi:hypothetical protein
MGSAGPANAQTPGPHAGTAPNTAVHPNALTFKGYEGVFVATDSHIRDIDPNGTLENHGPSLVVGSTDSVGMTATGGGGFVDIFRSDEGAGAMFTWLRSS